MASHPDGLYSALCGLGLLGFFIFALWLALQFQTEAPTSDTRRCKLCGERFQSTIDADTCPVCEEGKGVWLNI
jgi:hypothetical protein